MAQNKKDKIRGAILLSMIGDMIGFANGYNEFNNNTFFTQDNFGDTYRDDGANYSNLMVFDFMYNGGFSSHPKPLWTVSDDSIMLFANGNALVKWKKDSDKSIKNLINHIKLQYIEIIKDRISLENFEKLYNAGLTTVRNLKKIKNGDDYNLFPYDDKAGGSGGTMRAGIFGIIFNKESDKLKLIESTIESTLLTHPNAIAFLGSVAIALFASYAMQGNKITKWCIDMLEIMESNIIDNYISEHHQELFPFYERDKKIFINKWKDYIEDKFDEHLFVYKKSMMMKFPSKRTLYYDKFSSRKKDIYPGAGGDDSTIIAYDCLIDSDGIWDKIVIYSMLHVGDSDTTGSICAFLYGLYYGTSNVYEQMINNIIDHKANGLNLIEKLTNIV